VRRPSERPWRDQAVRGWRGAAAGEEASMSHLGYRIGAVVALWLMTTGDGFAQADRQACQNAMRECYRDCARVYSSGTDKDRCQATCQSTMARCASGRSSLPVDDEIYALLQAAR
jgi:hypothetical protein